MIDDCTSTNNVVSTDQEEHANRSGEEYEKWHLKAVHTACPSYRERESRFPGRAPPHTARERADRLTLKQVSKPGNGWERYSVKQNNSEGSPDVVVTEYSETVSS